MKSIIVHIFAGAVVLLATPGASLKAAPDEKLAKTDVSSIEDRVWGSDEQDLSRLHLEVVRMMQKRPASPWAHYLLSHIQVRQFSMDPSELHLLRQASELAQQAVDLDPKSEFGYIALSDILDLMGYSGKAAALLDEAEASGINTTWRFPFTRARLISDQAHNGRVLGLLEKALNAQESRPAVIVPYIVAVLQNSFVGEELIEKLADWNTRNPHLLFDQASAKTYTDLNRPEKAYEIYARIQKSWPENREAKVNAAILLYRNLKRGRDASVLLEKVLAESTENLEASVESTIRVHLAAAYLSQKRNELAKANFLRSMKISSDVVPIIDFAAKEYRVHKQQKGLVDFLIKANREIPGTGIAYALLGETLSETLKDHKKAIRAFRDAITLEPQRSDFYNGLGLTYYRMEQFPDALNLFTAATRVDPNDATARYNEACALALLGRSEEALGSLQEAIALDPRLQLTAQSDKDFASIRQNAEFHALVASPENKLGPDSAPQPAGEEDERSLAH